jgi:CRISPR/Cas system-associated endonuclease Cas1
MTNEELHDKIHQIDLASVRIEGKIDNIVNLMSAHTTADAKEFGGILGKIEEVNKKVMAIEGRHSKALWLALAAIFEGIVIWFAGSKH